MTNVKQGLIVGKFKNIITYHDVIVNLARTAQAQFIPTLSQPHFRPIAYTADPRRIKLIPARRLAKLTFANTATLRITRALLAYRLPCRAAPILTGLFSDRANGVFRDFPGAARDVVYLA